jgi:hypothetical protein
MCLVCGSPHTQSIALIVTLDDAPLPKCYKRLILPDGDPCKDARAPDS